MSIWVAVGGLLSGLAVAAGAIGAHALDSQFEAHYADRVYEKKNSDGSTVRRLPLGPKRLADFKTGAEYQLAHGLAILAMGLAAGLRPSRGWHIAAGCFLLGILGFSGGLYGLTVLDMPILGATIVPIGGVLFLAGWTAVAITAIMAKPVLSR